MLVYRFLLFKNGMPIAHLRAASNSSVVYHRVSSYIVNAKVITTIARILVIPLSRRF